MASKRSVKLDNLARKAHVPQRSRPSARPALPEKRVTLAPRNEGWLLAGVILVTAIAYLRCLGNGFVFDDLTMIRINEYIGEWSFLWRSMVHDSWWFRDPNHLPQSEYYRPLQDIWLALNYHLFGFKPLGWHATTIALHLVAVWLVYQIVRVIAPGGWTALIAALLFGLIPIHSEAVAWATAIPLPLSSTFELGAFYFFLRREARSQGNWALSLLLYAGALLSHESAIVFPGLIAAYALLLEPRGPSARLETSAAQITDAAAGDTEALRARLVAAAIETLPFAAEIGGYLVLRLSALGFLHRIFSMSYERTAQILMTAPWTLLHFLWLVVVPWSAAPWHRVRLITSPFLPEFYWPLAAFALIAAVLMFGRFRKRRLYLFCAAWFVLPLIPEMDLIISNYLTFVADRFLYLPSFGWCLFLADAIATSAAANESLRKPVFIGVAGLAALYGFVLFSAQRFWHDGVTFFSYCVEEFPEAALCHQGLGNAFGMRLDLKDAQRELSTAVSLNPEIFNVRWDLGMVEGRMEHYTEAVNEMRASLALRPGRSASDYATYADYADVAGEAAECERALEVTETLLGGRKEAQLVRARMRFRHGDAAGAMQILNEMVAEYPDEMRVWLLMGTIRMARTDYDGAFAAFERAIVLAPDLPAAHYYAADALHHMGRNAEALTQCRTALALAPYYQEARALMTVIQQHGSENQ